LRIHGTDVVYRFQDVVTKGDADDNRDIIVHMDPVNHFWEPFFRVTSLSLAVPMTRHQSKVDRDFSSINVENTYNVHAVCTYVLATGHIVETNLPRFDYSHEASGLNASFVMRATLKAVLYIAQFRKCAGPRHPGVSQNGN